MVNAPPTNWITPKEASRLLNRSLASISLYTQSGLLSTKRIGGRVYINHSDVLAFEHRPRLRRFTGDEVTVYQFDLRGRLIGTYAGFNQAADETGLHAKAIRSATTRGSVCGRQFYFSHNRDFVAKPSRSKSTLEKMADDKDRIEAYLQGGDSKLKPEGIRFVKPFSLTTQDNQ